MKQPDAALETLHDFELPGACLVCGGDLAVRLRPGTARTLCVRCRWLSSPDLRRGEDGLTVIHPAASA